MDACCKKTLKKIAGDIALHVTEANIKALIECDKRLMYEKVSHPWRGGRGKYDYYCKGTSSVYQIKTLHKMGAIAEDMDHPDKTKYTGMGADYTSYYKLSTVGEMILKCAAPWYTAVVEVKFK